MYNGWIKLLFLLVKPFSFLSHRLWRQLCVREGVQGNTLVHTYATFVKTPVLFTPHLCVLESRRWRRRRQGARATQKKGWSWRRSAVRGRVPIYQRWNGQPARAKTVTAHRRSATRRIRWPAARPLLPSCRCPHAFRNVPISIHLILYSGKVARVNIRAMAKNNPYLYCNKKKLRWRLTWVFPTWPLNHIQ